MAQVRAEEGHGDDVEENHPGILKSHNDHSPGVGFTEGLEVGVDPDGEVKEVVDHEGEDGESRPDHDEGRFGSLHGGFMSVSGAGRLVFLGQEDGEDDVEREDSE